MTIGVTIWFIGELQRFHIALQFRLCNLSPNSQIKNSSSMALEDPRHEVQYIAAVYYSHLDSLLIGLLYRL